jgi:potassium-transporting ATPase KdpC subunit
MKTLLQSLRLLILLTLLTGILYPLLVTAVAGHLFAEMANGSLISKNKRVIGSSLIAQKCAREDLFWPRPSACDYGTLPSGASNFGPTSAVLAKTIMDRQVLFGADAPVDLLTASGSGLDPHVSPEGALYQVPRIAKSRHLSEEQIKQLVAAHTESPQYGFLGSARVNILALNIALQQLR